MDYRFRPQPRPGGDIPPDDRDADSEAVVKLLAGISELVWGPHLYHGDGSGIWIQLVRRGLKPRPMYPGNTIRITSGTRPMVEIGVFAEVAPDKYLEFCISFYHDTEHWQIDTVVTLDDWPEEQGQTTLCSFPTRRATTIDECIEQLRAAAVDLASCTDVLDEPPVLPFLPRRS